MKNKVAFITGGTGGIGRAAAVEFARAGAHVVITGRRPEEGQKTLDMLKPFGVRSLFIRSDASKEQEIAGAIQQTLQQFDRLDYAFNNAGVEGKVNTPTTEHTEADYRYVFDINVLGVSLSMKHEIPAMLRNGGGAIVNNASVAGRVGMPGVGIYIASKHAVLGLTKCAALEVAKQGIRINAVSPAVIETEMFDRFADSLGGDQARDYMTSLHPIGRRGKAPEVAKAVVFLCSDGASFITGHDLLVDGGLTVP